MLGVGVVEDQTELLIKPVAPCLVVTMPLSGQQLYTTAAVIAAERSAVDTGNFTELSSMTSLKTFVSALAGHIAAEAARLG